MKPRKIIMLVLIIVTGVVLFVCGLLGVIFYSLKNCDVNLEAMKQIRGSAKEIEKFGEPIEFGRIVTGSLKSSGDNRGYARLAGNIVGTKNTGSYCVRAEKRNGSWVIVELKTQIDLIEKNSTDNADF